MANDATIMVSSDDWVSLNSLGDIVVGLPFLVQNQSSKRFKLIQSTTKPDINSFSGETLTSLNEPDASETFPDGALECWVRNVTSGESTIRVYVRDLSTGGVVASATYSDEYSFEYV